MPRGLTMNNDNGNGASGAMNEMELIVTYHYDLSDKDDEIRQLVEEIGLAAQEKHGPFDLLKLKFGHRVSKVSVQRRGADK